MKTSKGYLNFCLKYFNLKSNITEEDFDKFMINYEMFDAKNKKSNQKMINKNSYDYFIGRKHYYANYKYT